MTIGSDDEEVPENISFKEPQDEAKLNPDFIFDLAGDPYLEFGSHVLTEDLVQSGSKLVRCPVLVRLIVGSQTHRYLSL